MDRGSIGVDKYLEEHARQEHELARWIRDPNPVDGTVHTPREIAQQPLLWRYTADQIREEAADLRAFLQEAGVYGGERRPTVVFAGAGSSDYVGMSVVDLLRMRLNTHVVNWPTTRITSSPDTLLRSDRRYLMVHISRSGSSPESLAALELGMQLPTDQMRHLVITCNPDGELARLAGEYPGSVYTMVLNEAAHDKGLAMTSSFSCMVTAAQALGYLGEMDMFCEVVEQLAQAGEYLLREYTDTVFSLAEKQTKRVFYLGNNDLLGAAVESALKVQELTGGQVVAKGEDTLAFRHGPISAVNEQSLCCFFLSNSSHTRSYELDVVRQYQDAFAEVGSRVVLFSNQRPQTKLHEKVLSITYSPDNQWDVPFLMQANLAVLFGQLFSVATASKHGSNIDDPSIDNAFYHRVVQGVRIHPYVEA